MGRRKAAVNEEYRRADDAVLKPFLDELRSATDERLRSDFIRKHITTGDPAVISRDTYFELRRRVSAEFAIHPSAVVLVGSCRLGFSLKPKGSHNGPKLRFVAATAASDVDVAVVSQALFDEIWDAVFMTVYPKRDWPLDIGRPFTRDLFNGWIDPTVLPNTPRFARAVSWSRFFAGLSRERLCGMRTINGRLYRTWARLEAYQEHMVRDCVAEFGREGR
jgi:hypothetical protein